MTDKDQGKNGDVIKAKVGESAQNVAVGKNIRQTHIDEAKITLFDQQGQKVATQYNAAGDININPEPTTFPKALSAKIPRIAPEKIVGRDSDLVDLL